MTVIALMLAAAVAVCPPIGTRKLLLAPEYDPRVIVWRSRSDLHRFQQTSEAEVPPEVAFVVTPWTQVVVTQCPTGDRHAIGIKLTQGPYIGRYGWVDSEDVK